MALICETKIQLVYPIQIQSKKEEANPVSKYLSKTTKPVAFRIPNEVHAILERRAKRKGLSVGEYLKRKAIYDATRPH